MDDRSSSRNRRSVPVGLARAAVEATTSAELDERALQALEPILGRNEARRLVAGEADATDLCTTSELLQDVDELLGAARRRLVQDSELRASNLRWAASHHWTRLLLESAGEGLYGVDLEGRCTIANREAVRLLGYEHERELLGRHMHQLIHHSRSDGTAYPDDECRIFQAHRDGHGVVCDDELLFRKDGTSFPVEYRSYPIARSDGEVKGTVVTFVDITERKLAERRLERFQAERRSTALALHDNVVQALATANYAHTLGKLGTCSTALEDALQASQTLVTQLLEDSPIDEYILVRDEPSLTKGPA